MKANRETQIGRSGPLLALALTMGLFGGIAGAQAQQAAGAAATSDATPVKTRQIAVEPAGGAKKVEKEVALAVTPKKDGAKTVEVEPEAPVVKEETPVVKKAEKKIERVEAYKKHKRHGYHRYGYGYGYDHGYYGGYHGSYSYSPYDGGHYGGYGGYSDCR